MSIKVDSFLPKKDYFKLQTATNLCGVSVNDFIALAVKEKTLSTLKSARKTRIEPIPLEIQERILEILEQPNLFEEANNRFKERLKANPIDFSTCLD